MCIHIYIYMYVCVCVCLHVSVDNPWFPPASELAICITSDQTQMVGVCLASLE